MNVFVRLSNSLLRPFGLVITPARNLQLVYQHDYGAAGFDKYRDVQILHNKRKIERVWADPATLAVVAEYVRTHVPNVKAGICHGTRRGFEQAQLSKMLGCPVIGTEISDTAKDFPNTVQWDFHERNPQWVGAFTFAYSNSLDQAFDPKRALETWVEQLAPDGLLFIEHTLRHSAAGASEMDPFGAHPMVMPYLFFEWGKGKYQLRDIIRPTHKKIRPTNKKAGELDLWIFVIGKSDATG